MGKRIGQSPEHTRSIFNASYLVFPALPHTVSANEPAGRKFGMATENRKLILLNWNCSRTKIYFFIFFTSLPLSPVMLHPRIDQITLCNLHTHTVRIMIKIGSSPMTREMVSVMPRLASSSVALCRENATPLNVLRPLRLFRKACQFSEREFANSVIKAEEKEREWKKK